MTETIEKFEITGDKGSIGDATEEHLHAKGFHGDQITRASNMMREIELLCDKYDLPCIAVVSFHQPHNRLTPAISTIHMSSEALFTNKTDTNGEFICREFTADRARFSAATLDAMTRCMDELLIKLRPAQRETYATWRTHTTITQLSEEHKKQHQKQALERMTACEHVRKQ